MASELASLARSASSARFWSVRSTWMPSQISGPFGCWRGAEMIRHRRTSPSVRRNRTWTSNGLRSRIEAASASATIGRSSGRTRL